MTIHPATHLASVWRCRRQICMWSLADSESGGAGCRSVHAVDGTI